VGAVPWIDRVAEQAGPLTSVAQRFAQHHGLPLDSSTEDTLLGLARTIERDESDDERAMVEGAGALLGVILIAHFDGRHRNRGAKHRCQLGTVAPHITFDPFAAIERVIDADNIRHELAHQVQLAETEVRHQGPVSRVITELGEQLQTAGLPHRVSDVFDTTAWLGPDIEVDLSRVIDATHEGVSVERAVRRIVESLSNAGAQDAVPWSEARERILPRIVNAAFLSTLPGGGKRLWSDSVGPGIYVTLVLSYERRARYVRLAEIDRWGVTNTAAKREALKRLAARSNETRLGKVDTHDGSMVVSKTGDGLDSARVLLPGMFDLLRDELGPNFLVALPHRDTLIACAAEPAHLVVGVQEHAERESRRAPHAISDQLWRMTRPGLLEEVRHLRR